MSAEILTPVVQNPDVRDPDKECVCRDENGEYLEKNKHTLSDCIDYRLDALEKMCIQLSADSSASAAPAPVTKIRRWPITMTD